MKGWDGLGSAVRHILLSLAGRGSRNGNMNQAAGTSRGIYYVDSRPVVGSTG